MDLPSTWLSLIISFSIFEFAFIFEEPWLFQLRRNQRETAASWVRQSGRPMELILRSPLWRLVPVLHKSPKISGAIGGTKRLGCLVEGNSAGIFVSKLSPEIFLNFSEFFHLPNLETVNGKWGEIIVMWSYMWFAVCGNKDGNANRNLCLCHLRHFTIIPSSLFLLKTLWTAFKLRRRLNTHRVNTKLELNSLASPWTFYAGYLRSYFGLASGHYECVWQWWQDYM